MTRKKKLVAEGGASDAEARAVAAVPADPRDADTDAASEQFDTHVRALVSYAESHPQQGRVTPETAGRALWLANDWVHGAGNMHPDMAAELSLASLLLRARAEGFAAALEEATQCAHNASGTAVGHYTAKEIAERIRALAAWSR